MLTQKLNSLPKKRSTPSNYNSHLDDLVIFSIFFSSSNFLFYQIHYTFQYFPHMLPIFRIIITCVNIDALFPLHITTICNYIVLFKFFPFSVLFIVVTELIQSRNLVFLFVSLSNQQNFQLHNTFHFFPICTCYLPLPAPPCSP